VIEDSIVKDPALAPEGHRKIDWVAQHSPVLNTISENQLADGALRGRKIAMTIHLEAKTAYLALLLSQAGADVTVAGSNPLSTQDDVCAALAERGVRVFATHDPTDEGVRAVLAQDPRDRTRDHRRRWGRAGGPARRAPPAARRERRRGLGGDDYRYSETQGDGGEGVLPFPVLAANDARMKHLFDNRYGTGHSSLVALLSNTNLFISGKAVVVMGFGWVGRGLAKYADGLGARVIVCEPDPVKLLEAYAEGYEVMNSIEAAGVGDVFLTGTGN
jgi:adenosylhomocysteinase